jgi:hypothetical protein
MLTADTVLNLRVARTVKGHDMKPRLNILASAAFVSISLLLINTVAVGQSRGRARGTEKKPISQSDIKVQGKDAEKAPNAPKRRITIHLIEGEPISGAFLQASPTSIQIEVAGNVLNIKWNDISSIVFPDSAENKAAQTAGATSSSSQSEAAATKALRALRKLAGATEVGISFQEYGTRLIDVKAEVDEALSQLPDGEVKNEIKLAMEAYADAGQGWNASLGRNETLFPDLEPGRSLMLKYSIPIDNSIGMPLLPRSRVLSTIWGAARTHIERAASASGESKPSTGTSDSNNVPQTSEDKSSTKAKQSEPVLAGVWSLKITAPNGQSATSTLTITGTGNSYNGIATSPGGTTYFSISANGNTFNASFLDRVERQPVSVVMSGTVQDDSMSGTMKITATNGQTVTLPFTGTRVK